MDAARGAGTVQPGSIMEGQTITLATEQPVGLSCCGGEIVNQSIIVIVKLVDLSPLAPTQPCKVKALALFTPTPLILEKRVREVNRVHVKV